MIGHVRSCLRPPGFQIVIAAIVLVCGGVHTGNAGAQSTRADSLKSAIDSLRAQSMYDQAAGVAMERLSVLKSEPDTRSYELTDGERLIRTLEFAAALPESSKRELAEADGLNAALDRAYESGDVIQGEQLARRQLEIRRRLLGPDHPT